MPANTVLLAVADAFAAGAALTSYPRRPTPMLEGTLLILLLALTAAVLLVGDRPLIGPIGYGSLAIAAAYVGVVMLLRRSEQGEAWTAIALPEEAAAAPVHPWRVRLVSIADRSLHLRILGATATILMAGWALVVLGDRIAVQTGLGESFVGGTLLAAATSLPEMSATIMAVRLRSYTMAISNIFGSNLIMMILFLPADILYLSGPILAEAGSVALFATLSGIAMTAIYVAGLTLRSPGKILGMGRDSALVIVLYPLVLLGLYLLR